MRETFFCNVLINLSIKQHLPQVCPVVCLFQIIIYLTMRRSYVFNVNIFLMLQINDCRYYINIANIDKLETNGSLFFINVLFYFTLFYFILFRVFFFVLFFCFVLFLVCENFFTFFHPLGLGIHYLLAKTKTKFVW